VEYNGSDEATVLFAHLWEGRTENGVAKARRIFTAPVKKIDGNWLMGQETFQWHVEWLESTT